MHGLPLALNAGDGLFMMVWQAALNMPPKNSLPAQKILLNSFTSVLEGQAIELSWIRENRWDISEKDYLRMVGGKTASLISAACHVGALLGGAKPAQCERLKTFGYKIGLAFQIQDDLLNLVGDEEKYKKEIGGDIAEGKRTLMVIHCLPKLGAADASKMKKILGHAGASASEISWCTKKMQECGSIDYASKFARRLVEESLGQLEGFENCRELDDLRELAQYILEREE
jgi:geranylgeranyl pyrophosphate synthase